MKNKVLIFATLCTLLLLASVSYAQDKCTEDGSIVGVTKARSGRTETVTFEVKSTSPDYEVKTEKPPFQQYGSEKVLHIKGPYYKSVYFKSVMWMCTISEKLRATTSNIAAVKNIEQFEGYVDYIIGYKKKGSYIDTTKTTKGDRTKIVVKFRR